jgi:hypothetical protein
MSKDRLTETVAVRMTEGMRARLQERAKELEVREVDVVRWAVAQVLAGNSTPEWFSGLMRRARDREERSE